MPTFETPAPIDLAVNLQVGRIDVIASDRSDTVVTVAPTNPDKAVDRRGAEETRVDFDGTRVTIKGPKPRFTIVGPFESIDLRIEVPTGSRLTAELPVGAVRTTGRLGATRIKALTGAVDLGDTGDLWLRAGHGSVNAGAIGGAAEITVDHGRLRVASVGGDALLKASHGNVEIGETGGDLEAKLSYGDLEITRALASVAAKTAYGAISVGEVSAGSIQLESGYGPLSIGVREGVAAWLDLASRDGRVRTDLDGESAPEKSEESVAVRARTQFGDITVSRTKTKKAGK